jgi:hypothetical protein
MALALLWDAVDARRVRRKDLRFEALLCVHIPTNRKDAGRHHQEPDQDRSPLARADEALGRLCQFNSAGCHHRLPDVSSSKPGSFF